MNWNLSQSPGVFSKGQHVENHEQQPWEILKRKYKLWFETMNIFLVFNKHPWTSRTFQREINSCLWSLQKLGMQNPFHFLLQSSACVPLFTPWHHNLIHRLLYIQTNKKIRSSHPRSLVVRETLHRYSSVAIGFLTEKRTHNRGQISQHSKYNNKNKFRVWFQ